MAKKNQNQNTNSQQTNSFIKGLNKDADPLFVQEGMWTHARNAVNNTVEGDLGTISNEESNFLCAKVGTTMGSSFVYIIGKIHLYSDKWIVYSVAYDQLNTTPINSEIGLFEADQCIYRPIVQDVCLNFSKLNIITGASRLKDDCTWQVYWADGLNPDRYLNVGDPQTWPADDYVWLSTGPNSSNVNYYGNGSGTNILWPGVFWIQNCEDQGPGLTCQICKDINELDCDKLRIASLVKTPCLDINLSLQQGVIENGSYAVTVAYVINRQRVTNYFSPSYIQPIKSDINERGSFEITVDADSEHFDEFELVVVRFINQNLSAKRVGFYSTRTKKIVLDQIPETAATVSVETLILQNPVFEKSNQMSEVNNYLLRIGPTGKFDFNYQPLANLIQAEWVSIEYPETYYFNGGKNAGYLRDEVYSFFIRWVYNTGDKSASYHIPGRPAGFYNYNGNSVFELAPFINQVGVTLPGDELFFQSINTATITQININELLPDGGKILSRGNMGYWESAEIYPDFQPDVWNSSSQCWTQTTDPNYDLCGKPIRHHRFPDNALHPSTYHFDKKPDGEFDIRIMGVQFKNIIFPKDNDGNDIPGIVGYEILRGSRHGNKSILAKGMINNFRDYNPRGGAADSDIVGLYANYPFNTIVPQQNNLANPSAANYLYNDPFITKTDNDGDIENQNIPLDIISFHSPDTSFINPFLSTTELKIYGSVQGEAIQAFIEPSKHPKFKLISNGMIPFALATGVINALLKGLGEVKINYPAGNYTRPVFPLTANGSTTPPTGLPTVVTPAAGGDYDIGATTTAGIQAGITTTALNNYFSTGAPVLDFLTGGAALDAIFIGSNSVMQNTGQIQQAVYEKTYTGNQLLGPTISGFLSAITNGGQLFYYFLEGMQLAVDTLYAIIRKRQYALEMIAHGDYFTFVPPNDLLDRRFILEEGQYIFDQLQALPDYIDSGGTVRKYRINNLKRPKLAVLRTKRSNNTTSGPHFLLNSDNTSIDQSSMTLGHAIRTFNVPFGMIPGSSLFTPNIVNWSDSGKNKNFINKIASHYVGLKYRIENQYGQVDTIQQVVATPCEQKIDFEGTIGPNTLSETIFGNICNIQNFSQRKLETPAFFGGDTYVNRFAEKNIMHFFYNWLYDVPDNIEYNYFLNQMVPEPKFQVNSVPWDISQFSLANIAGLFQSTPDYGEGLLPNSFYDLDNVYYNLFTNLSLIYPGFVGVKDSYFYTSANGVRDFFVESEVLVDFREVGTFPWQTPYNKFKYTDLESLFDSNPDILAKGNYYAYDYSLSAARFLFNQYFTAGFLQGTTYNPNVAELCYVSYPNRINYSLQQQESDSDIDSWLMFLPLNKVDFKSKLSSVKSFAKTGMFITFENDSPLIYQGVDTLQLDDSGTKVTVGDAGLFAQAPQNVVVAERAYEYGSSQNRFGVISTPAGLYYLSQNQGKVLSFREGIQEISQNGMKWWFNEFLPYKLLEDFPNYPHTDNPVAGICCTASYNNDDSVLYFSKRDFKLKDEFRGLVAYDSERDNFTIPASPGSARLINFKLGDLRYFDDASWTTSYDPKLQFWVSFHDWHPSFYMPSKGNFLTTKGDSIWKHGPFCNDYCNFYGTQYPFEIELPVPTGQVINTVKSIEYYLECYRRDRNLCVDQFHVLDYNFDYLVVHNSGQASGYLNLNLYPKNDIPLSLQFPRLAANQQSYDVLYSKEEHKYRVNQFWDITKDRGEFPIGSVYPPTPGPYFPDPSSTVLLGNYEERNIWVTEPNGYIKELNLDNLDYLKPDLQRKKFRHYINFLKLSKLDSRNTNMILKILNTKTQYSPR
jgi:hypothetical protein